MSAKAEHVRKEARHEPESCQKTLCRHPFCPCAVPGIYFFCPGCHSARSQSLSEYLFPYGKQYNVRTALAYVSEKIRQNDESGAVSLCELDGIPALTLSQRMEDTSYITYLYFQDGALKELLTEASREVSAEQGTAIISFKKAFRSGKRMTAFIPFRRRTIREKPFPF